MTEIIDLSVIYLSYDEPQKEEFWCKIKDMVPWATRVDGVKGSDAAHKAAAEASETERFILIDGDNLPDPNFFDMDLDFNKVEPAYQEAQFRWKAVNHINGLCYGNGGISSWTRSYVRDMKTHEHSDGNPATTIDFCLSQGDKHYWSMYDTYSTTYPCYSPFQAWRAGFREGVKMCLRSGNKPSVAEFKNDSQDKNLNNLTIWHNIGSDVENGIWAIYGARLGTYMTMLTDWDHARVMWFDDLAEIFESVKTYDPIIESMSIGEELKDRLGLPACEFTAEQSLFMKRHLVARRKNLGPLVREMDVIKMREGW